jgi:hypothetical protein
MPELLSASPRRAKVSVEIVGDLEAFKRSCGAIKRAVAPVQEAVRRQAKDLAPVQEAVRRQAKDLALHLREQARLTASRTQQRPPASRTQHRPTASRTRQRPPKRRAAATPRSTRAGPDDDPGLERACEVCGGSLAGKRKHARTCGTRCRQVRHREQAALRRRYEAALGIVAKLTRPEQRIDLLAAVVWPQDARLRRAA